MMPSSMPAITKISNWICTSGPLASDAEVALAARHAIEDAVACMIAGAGDTAAAAVREHATSHGGGASSIIGSTMRARASDAALANGTAAHALDFDDVFMPAGNHAGAVLVPALLAKAEEIDANGAALLDAFVAGLQVQSAIAVALQPTHYEAGWHTTSTLGCVGAAAACARLMRLDPGQTADCLSLATSLAGGMKVQFGTAAKPLHAGFAAQHAVEAAELALRGVQASADALDGSLGMAALMHAPKMPNWGEALRHLSVAPLALVNPGLVFKRYPCCGSNIRILDALLELRERTGLQPGDVVRIDAALGHANVSNLMYVDPQDELQARFSLQYAVAVALQYGAVRLSDFAPGAVDRPELRPLLGLTTMRVLGADEESAYADLMKPHLVNVEMRNGDRISLRCEFARGTSANPFTEDDRARKFQDCCAHVFAHPQMSLIRGLLNNLDGHLRIRDLTRALSFQAGSDRGERFSASSSVGI